MKAPRCQHCGAPWAADKRQPAFKETCTQCNAYLHCCKNCRFHSPAAHNQCYIPNTDFVGDRKGANFCDEFEFAMTDDGPRGEDSLRDAARQRLGALFGDDDAGPKAPASLNDLFPE